MFQFPTLSSMTYGFSHGYPGITPGGLPHSEISGSLLARSSPKLIAACHVLLRLSTPKHPPCTLRSLIAPGFTSEGTHILPVLSNREDASHPSRTVKDRTRRRRDFLGPRRKPLAPTRLPRMDPVPPLFPARAEPLLEIRALSTFGRLRPFLRHAYPPGILEMTGFEPATSCLQSRRSPD